MRLGDVLSKVPKREFIQVDGFLLNKKGNVGQQVVLDVGQVALNYFCTQCEDIRTFYSIGKLTSVFVNGQIISIDCVLTCGCKTTVQIWFLVESDEDICCLAPRVRILKRSEKLSDAVKINSNQYGDFAILLDKAEHAYRDGLGAGAIVYLRKAFEKITVNMADSIGLSYEKYEGGNPRNFKELLIRVDNECSIIPQEFKQHGYSLFRELSSVVHGEYDEDLGLSKFEPLHRLVIGILENVRNREELRSAIGVLGWAEDRGDRQ